MWRTHLVFGILCGLLVYGLFSISLSIYVFLALVGISSLIVDIDHPSSKVGKKVKPVSFVTNFLMGHRGMIHSLIPAVLLFLVFVIFGYFEIGLALGLGYFSHLIADMLTLEGINFFYPLKTRTSGFIRTGGFIEMVFLLVCLIFIGFLIAV